MSARQSIGGTLSYSALAMLHKPKDDSAMHAEIHRLHKEQSLTANDISIALRLDHATVVNVLATVSTPRGIESVLARSTDALPLGRSF